MKNILDWSEDYKQDFEPNVEAGLSRLQARIAQHKQQEQIERFRRRRLQRWSMAASLALVASLVAMWQIYFSTTYLSETTTTAAKMINLEDGSVVHLNKNSHLQFAEDFQNCNRTVILEGEAFFEVEPNTDCPFVVKTAATTVTVLGTSFNVKANSNTRQTEVSVKTGEVEVMSNKSEQKVQLKHNEKVTHLHGKSLQSSKDKDLKDMAWHTLDFRNVPIKDIVEAMKTKYNVDIDLSQANIGDCHYTIDLNLLSLEAVLEDLQTSFEIEVEKNGTNTLVFKEGIEDCN